MVSGQFIAGGGFNGGALNQGLFFFGLKPIAQRGGADQPAAAVDRRLNRQFQTIQGAKVIAQQPAAVPGFSAQGGLSFQFNDLSNGGYSFTDLLAMANRLIERAKQTGAFSNLYTQFVSDAPVWRIEPDRDRMASLQVDFGTAMKVLGALNGGTFVNPTYEAGQYRQVVVQAEGSRRQTIQRLENLYVPAAGGALIPLANLVGLRLDSAPPIISHFDLNRTVLIQGFEAIGRSTGQAIDALSTAFQQLNLSTIGMDWSALSRSEVAAGSLAVLVFALGPVVVYLVLSAQYGSYIDPLVILMTVPLAILGALLFLVLNRQVNNVYAQVGMVTLIGLAAKNGILIVDLANQRMQSGLSDEEAAMGAAQSRLRPILMTASAALCGFFLLVVVLVAGGCGAWGEAMRQLAAIESPADPEA